MRSLLFILPGAAMLLCTTAGAATTACTVATGCRAAQMLFSNYRFDRTAPLDPGAAAAASGIMVSPISASLNAASVFSSNVNGGNGDIPADESMRLFESRPTPAAPAGLGDAGGGTDLNGVGVGSISAPSRNSGSSGLVSAVLNTPQPGADGWLRGRALGVGRFTDVGPRLSASASGVPGNTAPELGGSDTPSTVATPEPMPLLLIGSGLVVLGALARRRSAAVRS